MNTESRECPRREHRGKPDAGKLHVRFDEGAGPRPRPTLLVKYKWPLVRRSDGGVARSPCLTGPNSLTGPTKDDRGALCLKRWNHEWTRMNTNGKWECGAWSARFSISVFNHKERKADKKYLFSVFFAFFVVKNKWPLVRKSDGGLARSSCPTGPNGLTRPTKKRPQRIAPGPSCVLIYRAAIILPAF